MPLKTVFITGANQGIGLAFAKYYKSKDFKVIATSRKPSQELAQLGTNLVLDVCSDASIQQIVLEDKIDILINNAGILHRDDFQTVTRESMLEQFNTNTVGSLMVTKHLLKYLDQGSKVVNISSAVGSIAENASSNVYGYRASKAALNMVTKNLELDLKGKGIAVLALHPGYIQTNMTRGKGDMGPEESVARMAKIIEDLKLENSGEFRHRDGRVIPW